MSALALAAAALVVAGLCLVRVFIGPTLHDRTLAGSALIAVIIVTAAAVAVAARRADWFDVAFAMLLALVGLNVATLKLFRARSLQPPLIDEGGGR